MKQTDTSDPEPIPAHHWPQTQSLELMTHSAVTQACTRSAEGVTDAWDRFFARALQLGERVKQRRAHKTITAANVVEASSGTAPE